MNADYDDLFRESILFLDIETVPMVPKFKDLNPELQKIWTKMCQTQFKLKDLRQTQSVDDIYQSHAGLYAEFNKIITIAYAFGTEGKIEHLSAKDSSEYDMLSTFAYLLSGNNIRICGYNILGFDIPVLTKKMVKYSIKIPAMLNFYNKKPWEVNALDLSPIWRHTSNEFVSMDSVAHFLNIESSKKTISGDKVGDLYWENNTNIDIINDYCKEDVRVTIELYKHFSKTGII
jgi:DNA polymerase elongation subunit (family B)